MCSIPYINAYTNNRRDLRAALQRLLDYHFPSDSKSDDNATATQTRAIVANADNLLINDTQLTPKSLAETTAVMDLCYRKVQGQGNPSFILKCNAEGDADPKEVGSYLPVFTGRLEGRMIEHVFKREVIKHCRTVFGEAHQFGFMADWTVFDAIKRVKEVILDSVASSSPVLVVQLSIHSPRTTAWWPAILRCAIECTFPRQLYNFIDSYLNDRQIELIYPFRGQDVSAKRLQSKGLPSGSVLAPTLYNLLLWNLISLFSKANPQAKLISYGDELYLVVSHKNPVTLQKLAQQSIDFTQNWCVNNKMELDPNTTKVISLFDGGAETKSELNIKSTSSHKIKPLKSGLKKIEMVENMKIFGVNIASVLKSDEEIWKRKMEKRFAQLRGQLLEHIKHIQRDY